MPGSTSTLCHTAAGQDGSTALGTVVVVYYVALSSCERVIVPGLGAGVASGGGEVAVIANDATKVMLPAGRGTYGGQGLFRARDVCELLELKYACGGGLARAQRYWTEPKSAAWVQATYPAVILKTEDDTSGNMDDAGEGQGAIEELWIPSEMLRAKVDTLAREAAARSVEPPTPTPTSRNLRAVGALLDFPPAREPCAALAGDIAGRVFEWCNTTYTVARGASTKHGPHRKALESLFLVNFTSVGTRDLFGVGEKRFRSLKAYASGHNVWERDGPGRVLEEATDDRSRLYHSSSARGSGGEYHDASALPRTVDRIVGGADCAAPMSAHRRDFLENYAKGGTSSMAPYLVRHPSTPLVGGRFLLVEQWWVWRSVARLCTEYAADHAETDCKMSYESCRKTFRDPAVKSQFLFPDPRTCICDACRSQMEAMDNLKAACSDIGEKGAANLERESEMVRIHAAAAVTFELPVSHVQPQCAAADGLPAGSKWSVAVADSALWSVEMDGRHVAARHECPGSAEFIAWLGQQAGVAVGSYSCAWQPQHSAFTQHAPAFIVSSGCAQVGSFMSPTRPRQRLEFHMAGSVPGPLSSGGGKLIVGSDKSRVHPAEVDNHIMITPCGVRPSEIAAREAWKEQSEGAFEAARTTLVAKMSAGAASETAAAVPVAGQKSGSVLVPPAAAGDTEPSLVDTALALATRITAARGAAPGGDHNLDKLDIGAAVSAAVDASVSRASKLSWAATLFDLAAARAALDSSVGQRTPLQGNANFSSLCALNNPAIALSEYYGQAASIVVWIGARSVHVLHASKSGTLVAMHLCGSASSTPANVQWRTLGNARTAGQALLRYMADELPALAMPGNVAFFTETAVEHQHGPCAPAQLVTDITPVKIVGKKARVAVAFALAAVKAAIAAAGGGDGAATIGNNWDCVLAGYDHQAVAAVQARAQQQHFEQLCPGTAILMWDFKRNMELNIRYWESSGWHWAKPTFIVFGACGWRRRTWGEHPERQNFVVYQVEKDRKDGWWVGQALDLVREHTSYKQLMDGIGTVHLWSDGGSHFRNNEIVLRLLRQFVGTEKLAADYSFDAPGHGKAEVDGLFNAIARALLIYLKEDRSRALREHPSDFFDWLQKEAPGGYRGRSKLIDATVFIEMTKDDLDAPAQAIARTQTNIAKTLNTIPGFEKYYQFTATTEELAAGTIVARTLTDVGAGSVVALVHKQVQAPKERTHLDSARTKDAVSQAFYMLLCYAAKEGKLLAGWVAKFDASQNFGLLATNWHLHTDQGKKGLIHAQLPSQYDSIVNQIELLTLSKGMREAGVTIKKKSKRATPETRAVALGKAVILFVALKDGGIELPGITPHVPSEAHVQAWDAFFSGNGKTLSTYPDLIDTSGTED
jgi:hypothetical protein